MKIVRVDMDELDIDRAVRNELSAAYDKIDELTIENERLKAFIDRTDFLGHKFRKIKDEILRELN